MSQQRELLSPKQQILSRELKPKYSFGQNFLNDTYFLQRIADLAFSLSAFKDRDESHARFLEFGPGTGALTAALLNTGAKVDVVERDRDMIPILNQRFSDDCEQGLLKVHEADASEFRQPPNENFVLCGNLPYHLTSKILFLAVEMLDSLDGVVFLIQKEVADRICAPSGNKTYGVLSVLIQHFFVAELSFIVPKGAFWPAPDVDGGVMRLKPRKQRLGGEVRLENLKKVVKTAFSQRRKTLRNCLKTLFSAEELEGLDINPKERAEQLSVEDFVRMAQYYEKRSITNA